MKKIEPIDWIDVCELEGVDLYTAYDLQAVAEAVHQQWLLYCDNQSEMEMPDPTAIINQLTRQ